MSIGASNGNAQGGAGPEAARSVAPASAALPCQKRNNSIHTPASGYKLKLLRKKDWDIVDENPFTGELFAEVFDVYQDSEKRQWRDHYDGTLELDDPVSTGEQKTAFAFRANAEAFINHFGREHCAFWTITDQGNLNPREFAKRWNSFRTNEGAFIRAFMRVLEPQKNGRPHYHFLVAVSWDLQPDTFNWSAFHAANEGRRAKQWAVHQAARKRYVGSVPMETRALWKRLRDVLPRYGLGRSEFLPLRKTGRQVSNYVGKYLEAGLKLRRHEWKGSRRVEYSRRQAWRWKTHGRQVSWLTPRAIKWRQRVAAIAAAVHAADLDELAARLGKKWAYKLRQPIIETSDEDFQDWLNGDLPYILEVEAWAWAAKHQSLPLRWPRWVKPL